VKGDRLAEKTETFSLTLRDAQGATLADGLAIGTIHDDDRRWIEPPR
jgi:hypothetical protein